MELVFLVAFSNHLALFGSPEGWKVFDVVVPDIDIDRLIIRVYLASFVLLDIADRDTGSQLLIAFVKALELLGLDVR